MALNTRELTECAERSVQRQAARIHPGVAKGVERDAFQMEVSLELVVPAAQVTDRVDQKCKPRQFFACSSSDLTDPRPLLRLRSGTGPYCAADEAPYSRFRPGSDST